MVAKLAMITDHGDHSVASTPSMINIYNMANDGDGVNEAGIEDDRKCGCSMSDRSFDVSL